MEINKITEPIQENGKKPEKPIFIGKFSLKMIFITVLLASVVFVIVDFTGENPIIDNPKLCRICHNMQPYYDSWQNSHLEANKHAAADLVCHDCHESSILDQVEQVWKYVTSDFETPLEKREFGTVEFCTGCHDFSSFLEVTNYEESNPHNSHNGLLECNSCHWMHEESQVLCKQCHIFEWTSTLPENWRE